MSLLRSLFASPFRAQLSACQALVSSESALSDVATSGRGISCINGAAQPSTSGSSSTYFSSAADLRSGASCGLGLRQGLLGSLFSRHANRSDVMGASLPHGLPSVQQQRSFQMIPRSFKYRKLHKGVSFGVGICPNTTKLSFGLYGIRSLEAGRLSAKQLESVRRALRRKVKKTTKVWITVAPTIPVTGKPAEVRMGKGKGAVSYYAAPIKAGQILFEMDRLPRTLALQALEYVKPKFPIRIGFVEWS